MFAQITGTIIKTTDASVIVDTGAIAYEIQLSDKNLDLIETDKSVSLWTYLHVTESALYLFGFWEYEEREMFKLLISISGVGPKLALKILGHATPDEIQVAVIDSDPALFKSVSGIGNKNAQRIILELQNRLGKLGTDVVQKTRIKSDEIDTIHAALAGLGYHRPEIQKALKEIEPEQTTEEKIKQILKKLG